MAEKTDVKADALPDLDDLLQCPVCYEIPSGQIFQCNEGHHVCGRCKQRLHQCPVCRALFFGTRNYAMEELIANVKKLRAFKLGGKVTTGSSGSESATPAEEGTSGDAENDAEEDEEDNLTDPNLRALRAPQACKGLFRCLCCKNGNSIRLPAARLLNHLRYFHSPELIEGQSENGEYLQAWQFSTVPGRIVTAVRVSDMGIFFFIIEISNDSVYAWLSMAAAPWVTNEFSYTVTISGNDREAIFSDCVWSVRSCEGFLKKRGRCLVVNGLDARALVAPATISGKLSVHRVRPDDIHQQMAHPRAVLRVASRGQPACDYARDNVHVREPPRLPAAADLDPFIQDLQNDVARLSRAFATLDREGNTLRARLENGPSRNTPPPAPVAPAAAEPLPPAQANLLDDRSMSRNARRRMRRRLRATLNEILDVEQNGPASNGHVSDDTVYFSGLAVVAPTPAVAHRTDAPSSTNANRQNVSASSNPIRIQTGLAIVQPSPVSAPTVRPQVQLGSGLQRNAPNNPVQIQTGLATVQQAASSAQRCPAAGAQAQGSRTEPVQARTSPAPNGQPQNANRTNKKRRHRR